MPAVTYVVSAYDRPMHLRGVLASLQVQTDGDFEVIVADNGANGSNYLVTKEMDDLRFKYMDTAAVATSPCWDCYWSAEWIVANIAKGEWLCFPSDDAYYMPVFQEACLALARKNNLQLVFPEMLYDRRLNGQAYSKLNTRPSVCGIDKIGFLIHRDIWIGFPTKPTDYLRGSCCDGEMIAAVVEAGARWGKVEEVLCIHN